MMNLPLWPDEGKAAVIKSRRRKRGTCIDCGVPTDAPSKLRCRPCAGKARRGKPVGTFRDRVCVKCGATYTPNMGWQKQCFACLAVERACVDCGAEKRSQGPRCRACVTKEQIGRPATWNQRPQPTPQEIIAAAEALGLTDEATHYAFGYVIGVAFGDGAISEETNTIPYTCKDGTVTTHQSTVYRVRLQTVFEVFAHRFAEQWTILTGKVPTIQTTVRSKWSASSVVKHHRPTRLYMVQPRHTVLGRYLQLVKYREENGSARVLGYPLTVQQAFVHGMIDSEGHVGKSTTRVSNTNHELLETVSAILRRFGRYSAIHDASSAWPGFWVLTTATRYDKFDVAKYRPPNRDWTRFGASLDSDRQRHRFD